MMDTSTHTTPLQEHLSRDRKKAMGIFVTSGFPDKTATLPLLQTIDEAGADFIELGMPFSDPLAEGLPIQRSSELALRNGITLHETLTTAEKFRSKSDTPLLLMGYLNPVYRYGISNFCRDARSSGVDGLILPDLPAEEAHLVQDAAEAHGIGVVFLIAPNTPDARVRLADERASAFVYAVSMTGLTGSTIDAVDAVASYLERARRLVRRNPLMVGFGIKTRDDAARLSRHTDGFIVGSAVIELIERLWTDGSLSPAKRLAAVRAFVAGLVVDEGRPADSISYHPKPR